jgi:hypothetical protein
MTIDFPDTSHPGDHSAMDLNLYALELVVRDRLARLRAEAALHALVAAPRARTPRPSLRARLGHALIGLGRRLRGPEPRALRGLTRG